MTFGNNMQASGKVITRVLTSALIYSHCEYMRIQKTFTML